ncbi:hypothetical protein [Kitasatospora sp. NPDC001132]
MGRSHHSHRPRNRDRDPPAGRGLRYGRANLPDHQLTVYTGTQPAPAYMGTLSPDGPTFTFTNVDLRIPTTVRPQ